MITLFLPKEGGGASREGPTVLVTFRLHSLGAPGGGRLELEARGCGSRACCGWGPRLISGAVIGAGGTNVSGNYRDREKRMSEPRDTTG